MKLALLKSPMNRTATILGFFTSLLGFCEENFKTVGFVEKYVFIGAGYVLAKDIPNYAFVYGSPAKIKGWMCECGIRLEFNGGFAKCKTCGKEYKMVDENKVK